MRCRQEDVSKTDSPSISSPQNTSLPVSTSSHYNALGFEISKTDANGHTTHYRNNAYGSPIEITYPDGSKEIRQYECNGLLHSQTDPDGLTTLYTYDIFGRILTKTYISSEETVARETFSYNSFHLLSETNKEGYCTSYAYDGAGRKIRETTGPRSKEFSYDALGRLETTRVLNDENTLVTTYTRDLLDNILEEVKTDIKGIELYKISYTYDEAGNRQTTTRYVHNQEATETFIYDAFDRLIEHTDALGYRTQTTYNERHQNSLQQYVLQKTITDPLGKTTIITFDTQGNRVKEEKFDDHRNPLAGQESFYDPKGSLILQNDLVYENHTLRSRQTTTYSYNDQAQITSLTRAAGLPLARTTYYTYTPGGKLSTKTLPDNTTLTYTYSPLGYKQTISSSDGSIHQAFIYDLLGTLREANDLIQETKVKRKVDPFGNILEETYSTGLSLHKIYDNINRPLTITLADGSQIGYSYDPCYLRSVQRYSASKELLYTHSYDSYDLSGRLLAETLPFTLGSTEHTYDALGRKASFSAPFLTETNIYDPIGNLSSRTLNENSYEYTYDGLSQVISENAPLTQTHRYDSLHNRKGKNSTLHHINELNEILSQGDISCKYDLKGNLTLKHTQQQANQMTFDALNRLLLIKNDSYKAFFCYDALGRRLSKQVHYNHPSQGWQESYSEHYLYDNNDEIGAFSSPDQPKQLRIPGIAKQKNLSSLLAIELGQTPYIALTDAQDNIRQIIDPSTRSPLQKYDFTAFGERLDSFTQSTPFNPWCYASKRLDPEFNLLYFGQRYYDPGLGRWLSTDPAGFVDSNNLYQYLLNNPFKYQDPRGENLLGFCLGIGEMLLGGVIMVSGGALEILTLGSYTFAIGFHEAAGLALVTHGFTYATQQSKDISFRSRAHPRTDYPSIPISKYTDVYAPTRPLPMTEDGIPIPDTDAPHTQLGTKEGSKENYPKAREFDKDGKLVRDIDFTDHGYPHNHPIPHQHRHRDNPTGGTPIRGKPEPVPGWVYNG